MTLSPKIPALKHLAPFVLGLLLLHGAHGQQQGIINNAKSPHVALKSINIGDCRWTDGFWADKFKLCEEVMVPHMGSLLKGDVGHAYDNFKIVAGLEEGGHQGTNWHDGDFYKWMESAAYVYAINKDPEILGELDEIIGVIGKAQADDGYLQTATMLKKLGRYTNRAHHEMYNSGHLLTSACIHHRVTGKRNFLDIAVKNARHLCRTFQPRPKELARFGFNQTQIMGLVELYRTTGDKQFLQLAETFINMRGQAASFRNIETRYNDPTVRPTMVGDMVQERTALRRSKEAAGHAVLALYFYAGAADVYAETGEMALVSALDRLWDSVVNHKMYVTGACGQTHHGSSSKVDFVHEAFIRDYMMPNLTAYNETCANICNAMFSYRMLGIHGESKYADIMELVLYNSGLSAISADGTHYFYTNPLRRTHDHEMDTTDQKTREPYIPCFCCPPNIVRTIAKVSGWAYSLSGNGVAVNLYGGNTLATTLLDGSELKLTQETGYPWDGAVKITVESCKPGPFDMMLRIPDWAEGSKLLVNGGEAGIEVRPGTYATITRVWKPGDVVTLEMPMDARLLVGHPLIEEVRNQAAIKRGPVVYCMETPDLPEGTSVLNVYLPSDIKLVPQKDPAFKDGLTTLGGKVLLYEDRMDAMYRPMEKRTWKEFSTQFVPYYAWSNRGEAEMTVWLPIVWNSKVRIPRIAGDYVHVYKPGGDVFPGPKAADLVAGQFYKEWVPNDHCFVRDESERWHAFGITHPLTDVDNIHAGECLSFHAIAPPGTLKDVLKEGSWKDLPKVLPPSERPGEIEANHAPWILKRNGLFHMVYGPTPLRYAVSRDLKEWTPKGNLQGAPSGRDPQVFVWNEIYHLIVCGVHDVRAATSRDFKTWTEHGPILTMKKGVDPESPSLVRHNDTFYLFVCGWNGIWDRKDVQGAYQHKTYVYQSDDPLKFELENEVAVIDAHAPEIFQDEAGDWFISSVEWPHRGVSIAPLVWE